MGDTTCSVAGCQKPTKRSGYCYGHYMKNWRYGTPTPVHPNRSRNIAGLRFGALVALSRADQKWLCRCDCGDLTVVRLGDLNRGTAISCGASFHHRSDAPGYSAAHRRVREALGRARNHPCVDCGGSASQWSYDHADGDEMVGIDGYAYSAHPDHYDPRCVPCHKRFDLDRIDSASRR